MYEWCSVLNPLNTELNPICHLLALLEAHHILHISRIRINCVSHKLQICTVTSVVTVSTLLSLSHSCPESRFSLFFHYLLTYSMEQSPS